MGPDDDDDWERAWDGGRKEAELAGRPLPTAQTCTASSSSSQRVPRRNPADSSSDAGTVKSRGSAPRSSAAGSSSNPRRNAKEASSHLNDRGGSRRGVEQSRQQLKQKGRGRFSFGGGAGLSSMYSDAPEGLADEEEAVPDDWEAEASKERGARTKTSTPRGPPVEREPVLESSVIRPAGGNQASGASSSSAFHSTLPETQSLDPPASGRTAAAPSSTPGKLRSHHRGTQASSSGTRPEEESQCRNGTERGVGQASESGGMGQQRKEHREDWEDEAEALGHRGERDGFLEEAGTELEGDPMASLMSRLQLGGMKADLVEKGAEEPREGTRQHHHHSHHHSHSRDKERDRERDRAASTAGRSHLRSDAQSEKSSPSSRNQSRSDRSNAQDTGAAFHSGSATSPSSASRPSKSNNTLGSISDSNSSAASHTSAGAGAFNGSARGSRAGTSSTSPISPWSSPPTAASSGPASSSTSTGLLPHPAREARARSPRARSPLGSVPFTEAELTSVPNQGLHVLEVYDLSPSVRTSDVEAMLRSFTAYRESAQEGSQGHTNGDSAGPGSSHSRVAGNLPADIRWLDDEHAVLVFPGPGAADSFLSWHKGQPYKALPVRRVGPASSAFHKLRPKDFDPPKVRPKTSAEAAQRMIAGASDRATAQAIRAAAAAAAGNKSAASVARAQEAERRRRLEERRRLRAEAWGDEED